MQPMTVSATRLAAIVTLSAGCASATPNAASAGAPAWITYVCESGRNVAAAHPDDSTAVVRYGGTTYAMRVAVSGSGARYTGGGYEWWTRGSGPGSTGRLSRFGGQELTAETLLEECAIPAR